MAPYPVISPYILAPLALACSSSSRTKVPPPPEITKPSLSASYALDAILGLLLYFDDKAPIASNNIDKVQCNSSPPPAKIMFCFPI